MAMVNLKILLGLFPATSKIEEENAKLSEEYKRFRQFAASEELAYFNNLEKEVTSKEFEENRKKIESLRFEDTKEYNKLQLYLQLKKSKRIKSYYKIKQSRELANFLSASNSKELEDFIHLQSFILSSEFKGKAQAKDFKKTPDYKKWREYKKLKKAKSITSYFKFKSSKKYSDYKLIDGSKEITEYENLGKFINSNEYKEVKAYMDDKHRYEKSGDFKKLQEYGSLKQSEKIKWYFQLVSSTKFDSLKHWEKTFEDDFNDKQLNREKWITKYFWGEALLGSSYSLSNELQCYSDGKNLDFSDSALKIITRKEKASSNSWNPQLGFQPKDYEYTSGIINSGASFRQQYGKFEAKIRLSANYPLTQAFWMVGDSILPEIDVMKFDGKKLYLNSFWGKATDNNGLQKSITTLRGKHFSHKFFIYTLEWTENALEWKINGITVKKETRGIPSLPMYVAFNSMLNKKINDSLLPASMEIDWIRCYQYKQ